MRHAHRLNGLTYLDHAATSAQRPASVAQAVADYLTHIGATPGRGGHRLAIEAGRIALRCRQRVAALLGVSGDVGRVTFAANATHALNTALSGVLRPRDRLVVTAYDHNSVLRPAAQLARTRDVDVVMLRGDRDGHIDDRALRAALDGARMLVINAASNVLGCALDVGALARAAREAGALTLVDVAQVAGHIPFSVTDSGVDMVAFTGHKGMLGPQGVGGLWVRAGIDVEPLITGGTGGNSADREMPAAYPDHLEAGTLNGPGLAGLIAGIDAVLAEGVATIHARLGAMKAALYDGLSSCDGVHVVSSRAPEGAPIVTITSDDVDPASLAAALDREHGVLTRAGLHCAPEAHAIAGTAATGAVRFSLGWSNTLSDVEAAVRGVRAIVGGRQIVSAGIPADDGRA